MKVGFCYGSWDGLNAAHLSFLKEAHQHCSWLIVGVNAYDCVREGAPMLPVEARMRDLYYTRLADALVPYYGDPITVALALRPIVVILTEGQAPIDLAHALELVRIPPTARGELNATD